MHANLIVNAYVTLVCQFKYASYKLQLYYKLQL